MSLLLLLPARAANITTSEWTKVEASTDFDANARYILVSGTAICSYTTSAATSAFLKPCSGTVTDKSGVISSIPDDAAIISFSGSGSSYKVLLSDYSKTAKGYYNTTVAKKMQLKSGLSDGTDASVAISDGKATITFGSYGKILYNTGSPRFLNYTSNPTTSMLLPTLYKEKVQSIVDKVSKWAK